MKKSVTALCLMCVLMTVTVVYGATDKQKLTAPVPAIVRTLVLRSIDLADRDRVAQAVAALR